MAAGAISGPGKSAGICKARNSAVVCKTGDGQGGFSACDAVAHRQRSHLVCGLRLGAVAGRHQWRRNGGPDLSRVGDVVGRVQQRAGRVLGSGGLLRRGDSGSAIHPLRKSERGWPRGHGGVDAGQAAPAVYWNNGVRFAAAVAAGPASARRCQRRTMQLIDINGDGREDLVVRGASQVECALSPGQGFGALQPCSIAGGPFAQRQEWWNMSYGQTFAVAHINGPVVVGGVPTGLIFAPFSNAAVGNRFRYLCNDCFTNSPDPNWKPELQASQIVWADFTGNGIDSPLLIRADGLYLGLTPSFALKDRSPMTARSCARF